MSELAVQEEERAVARPLRVLVPLIKDEIERGNTAGLEHYRKAGELLLEAKVQQEPGQFTAWAQHNFSVGMAQLRRYMRLVKESKNAPIGAFATLGDLRRATEPSYQSRPGYQSWHQPVRDVIAAVDTETLNLRAADLKRADEQDAQRKLGLQLIDIGYKVLASQLHPDKNKSGSHAAMARLNAVRARLKQCI